MWTLISYIYFSEGLVNDAPRAVAAIRTMIEATDYCANQHNDAAQIAAKAFRLHEADMKLYMSRYNYRMEMPARLVVNNFKEATEFATEQGLVKKIPDWTDFIRPQFMRDAAPDRTTS